MKEYICLHCGSSFLSSKKPKFCNKSCFYKHKNKHIDKTPKECVTCGKIMVYEDYRHNWKSKTCCSTKCQHEMTRIRMTGKSGENSLNWKGGVSGYCQAIRTSKKYIDWRTSCFERDYYRCCLCDVKGYLEVHHKYPFSRILEDHNIKNTDDANNCNVLWDLNNGITLCKSCHNKIHSGEVSLVSVSEK